MTLLCYVAGPYSPYMAPDGRGVSREENIARARAVALALWEQGFAVFCPHLNTAQFDDDLPGIPYETWLSRCLEILDRCDALVLLPEWEHGKGARIERAWAQDMANIPVHVWPDVPVLEWR